ncbi:hypothetical protein PIB19_11990 [Sphingomonas sp. 7/4-4]|uniref:hypothetical protein n=1 Tax=Sphingomonas sp. 7/4-4 TaxID=3018446 RepID=UPI0022F3CD72|nr:hypothetical protein [Sphingomonas sp. 7/4-4]WBY06339.1 hypothetical protein PIB19_11990 [Sphingomonas sp. 7/4-4]
MAEKVLRQFDLGPGAKPSVRDESEDRGGRAEHERRLEYPRILAADRGDRAGREREQREIGADRDQRQRLIGNRARNLDIQIALALERSDHRQCNRDHRHAARRDRLRVRLGADIFGAAECEFGDPHTGQRSHDPAQPASRGRVECRIKRLRQNESGNGDEHAEQQRRAGDLLGGSGRACNRGDVKHQCAYADERDHPVDGAERERRTVVGVAPVQRDHEAEPGKVPERLDDPCHHLAGTDPGDRQCPERCQHQRQHQRAARQAARRGADRPQCDAAEEQGSQRVAPQDQRCRHQRAPAGNNMTRIVWRRISRSRKGE